MAEGGKSSRMQHEEKNKVSKGHIKDNEEMDRTTWDWMSKNLWHQIHYYSLHYNLLKVQKKEIKPCLILIIIEKIRKNTKNSKNVNWKAIFRDSKRVNKEDMILPVTLKTLKKAQLYIDEDEILRPDTSHSCIKTLLFSLPLLSPDLKQLEKNSEAAFSEVNILDSNYVKKTTKIVGEILANLYTANLLYIFSFAKQTICTKHKFAKIKNKLKETFKPFSDFQTSSELKDILSNLDS